MSHALAVNTFFFKGFGCTGLKISQPYQLLRSPNLASKTKRYGSRYLMTWHCQSKVMRFSRTNTLWASLPISQACRQSVQNYAIKASAAKRKIRQAPSVPIARLRPSEVTKVFGRQIEENFVNDLLQTIQQQRLSGTLDQEIEQPGVTPDVTMKGLQYLRENYPFDEDAAIIRRLEKEDQEAENSAVAAIEKAKRWQPQDSAKENGVYGKPRVDESVRIYHEQQERNARARDERRQKRLENTEVIYEEELARVGQEIQRKITEVHIIKYGDRKVRKVSSTSYAPLDKSPQEQVKELSETSREPGLVKSANGTSALRKRDDWVNSETKWWHKYQKRAMLTDWDGVSEPPYMHWTKRWGLPTLFMLATIGTSLILASNYHPPVAGARLFPEIPPAAATVMALITLNIAAWLMWKTPPLWRFMNKYMLLHAVIPKPMQLLGNTFSHQKFSHLFMNMFLLWCVGTNLCDQIGRGQFLAVYIGGGVFASWASLTHFLATRQYLQASLGASGAICCAIACYLWINKGERMEWRLFPGDWKPSFKAEQLLVILSLVEVAGALYFLRSGRGTFDHFSHLGGYVAGVTSAELIRRRYTARRSTSLRRRT